MIDITYGNDWTLRIALSQDGEAFPVTSDDELSINFVSAFGKKNALTPQLESGIIVCDINGYSLSVGTYGIEVAKTGDVNWRTFGTGMVRITNETTSGGDNSSVGGDDYDIIMGAHGIIVNLSMAVDSHSGGGGAIPIENTLPQKLTPNVYYALDTPLTGAVSVELPEIEETNIITTISMNFFTAADFTGLSFLPSTGVTISYYDGYLLEAEKEYELNLLFNGVKWIVSYAVIS